MFSLDLLSTCLVKEHISVLGPVLNEIINASISVGIEALCFKTIVVIPLFKKASLDPNVRKTIDLYLKY